MSQQQKHKTVPLTTKATDSKPLHPRLDKATYCRNSILSPNGKSSIFLLGKIMRNGTRTRKSLSGGPKSPPSSSDPAPVDGENISEAAKVEPPTRRSRRKSNGTDSNGNVSQTAELASTYPAIEPQDSTHSAQAASVGSDKAESSFGNITPDDRVHHFTRSRNPIHYDRDTYQSDTNIQHSKPSGSSLEPAIPIDVCATALAGLDTRAYRRSILRDANGILEGILLPMSFPWEHKVVPSTKNLPCDIDEMPFVLSEDESHRPFDNGPLDFGRFDVGQLRHGPSSGPHLNPEDTVRSATRRSNETGVVELRTMALPPSPQEFLGSNQRASSQYERDASTEPMYTVGDSEKTEAAVPGEISLRCFEQVQRRKRRKLWESEECTKTQHISVRVGSSSTRSSIFPSSTHHATMPNGKSRLLLLPATLPAEVQTGRFVSASRAKTIGENLGSYNCRHGLGATNPSGKNSNRVATGRTRLIWTAKSPSEQPQRVYFTSLLTSERIESSAQKRPREIRVAVKVNGSQAQQGDYSRSSSFKRTTGKESLPHIDDVLDWTSDTKSAESRNYARKLQCNLDTDRLVKTILRDLTRRKSVNDRTTYTCASLELTPPRVDCLPDSNGLISVLCSMPGKILQASSVHEFLQDGACKNELRCSICWSSYQSGPTVIEECCICGVTVHAGCCLDGGEQITVPLDSGEEGEEAKWRCAVCCKFEQNRSIQSGSESSSQSIHGKPKRVSRPPQKLEDDSLHIPSTANLLKAPSSLPQLNFKCALCPHFGGAMSPFDCGGDTVWIHEVCRIWSFGGLKDNAIESKPSSSSTPSTLKEKRESQKDDRCALCGGSDVSDTKGKLASGLVKCAAARCQIHFHPMCARLASLFFEGKNNISENKDIEENKFEAKVAHAKMEDVYLCTQYTLSATSCVAVTGTKRKEPGVERFTSVPIAFCGIHNPKREHTFYGMYPGGRHLDESTLRIPPYDEA